MKREITVEIVNKRPDPIITYVNTKDDVKLDQPLEIIDQAIVGIIWKSSNGKYYGYAPLVPSKYLGNYTTSRWSFREKQQAMIDASRVLDEKRGLREIDVLDFEIQQMVICTRKCPVGVKLTPEIVGDPEFDADLGSLLLNACRLVNGPIPEEQRDFLLHSEQIEDTPGSRNTGR